MGATPRLSSFAEQRNFSLGRTPTIDQRTGREDLVGKDDDHEFDQAVEDLIHLLARLLARRWVREPTNLGDQIKDHATS
jgi:hypothetical protein